MVNTDDVFKKQLGVSSSTLVHKEAQKELLIIICSSLMDDDEITDWAEKLWQFQEAYAKILYTELSTFILDEKKEETIKIIKGNLDRISNVMDKNTQNISANIDHHRFWLKYKDHCELALLQRKHYHISIEEIEGKARTTALASVKEETDRIQKDLTSQLIGLVSIFTALSFVIFGGINILSSILENIRFAAITRMICAGLLWTICMSILFYIFVRFILKIMKPDQEQILSKEFMKSFWLLLGGLSIALVAIIVLSFYAPKAFVII